MARIGQADTLGARIRALREAQGLPQATLAEQADEFLRARTNGQVRLKQSHLSQIECEKVHWTDPRRVVALAHCLGVTYEFLLGMEEDRRGQARTPVAAP